MSTLFFLLTSCQSRPFCNKVVIIKNGMGADAVILRFFKAVFTVFDIVPDLTLLVLVISVDICCITKFDRWIWWALWTDLTWQLVEMLRVVTKCLFFITKMK